MSTLSLLVFVVYSHEVVLYLFVYFRASIKTTSDILIGRLFLLCCNFSLAQGKIWIVRTLSAAFADHTMITKQFTLGLPSLTPDLTH